MAGAPTRFPLSAGRSRARKQGEEFIEMRVECAIGKTAGLVLALCVSALGQTSGQPARQTSSPAAKSAASKLQYHCGQEALQNGDVARARTEFEKAVRLAPNDAEAQSALGWVLAQQGETNAAVTHLQTAIKLKPAFVDARLTLVGVFWPRKGNRERQNRKHGPRSRLLLRMPRAIACWREF